MTFDRPSSTTVRLLMAACTLFGVTACTGSETQVTPLAIVVVGAGPGGATVGLLASPLPPSGDVGGTTDPAWREDFATVLAGASGEPVTARDVVVVRGAVQEAWVLARGSVDYLFVASVADVRLDDPSSWSWSAPPIDLSARVARAGSLAGEPLCAVSADASDDGRWLGVLHDPTVCGGGSSNAPAVLMVDLDADPDDPAGVRPRVASTNDGRTRPIFLDWQGTQSLTWVTTDGSVLVLSTATAVTSPVVVATSDDTGVAAPLATGAGGRGLVVIDDDTLSVVPIDASDPVPPFDPDLPGGPRAVVDPLAYDPRAVVVRTSAGLSIVSGLGLGVPETSSASVSGALDALVDPYGYAFVATAGGVQAFDLLSAVTDLRRAWTAAPPATDLTSIAAIEWVYVDGAQP